MDDPKERVLGARVMTPEESLQAEKDIFQQLASAEGAITKEVLLKGWEAYYQFCLIRNQISQDESDKGLKDASEFRCYEIAKKRLGILQEKPTSLSGNDVYVGKLLFTGDTLGLSETGGSLGVLLRGLEGEELENAKKFCLAMNKVGLKRGDKS